jgi:hypothetical protein
MVFYDRDIVGSPARRRKEERLEWVAYCQTADKKGYYSVDLDSIDPNIDLLRVDAVGTGCIMIKRKVLETVKVPFEDLFDEYGIRSRGMDLHFCDKAREAGFEVWVAPHRVSEHFREMGLVTMDSQYVSHAKEEPMEKYGIAWGKWIEIDWIFIKDIIQQEKVKNVLEFGTGLSTLLMSEIADVDTYDKEKGMSQETKKKLPNGRDVNFNTWDGMNLQMNSKHYDLVLINGFSERPERGNAKEVALREAIKRCDRIVIHHAGFQFESILQKEYLKNNGFKLLSRNGWHQKKCHYWRRENAEENGEKAQGTGEKEVPRGQEKTG